MTVAGSEVTITTKDQTKYVFADTAPGRLKRIENRFGKALTLSWSASSATATDASSRATAIAIDSGNDRITSVTDSAGRAWTFAYTGTGATSDLTCITDPGSKVTRLGYTSHVLTTISRGGATCGSNGSAAWTIAYTSGKATSIKSPTVTTPDTFAYTAGVGAAWSQVIDPAPAYAVTTWGFDASGTGRVGVRDRPRGQPRRATRTTLTRTRSCQSTPTEDGVASTTSEYDARGNQTKETRVLTVTPAKSVVTRWTYNATNDLLTRTDADNDASVRTVTRWTYDGAGHLTSENRNCTDSGTDPPGEGLGGTCTGAGTQDASTNVITSYAYTASHQLEYEQDPLGRVTKHEYDPHGNETSTIANCTSSGTTTPSPFDSCSAGGTANAQTNVATSAEFLEADLDGGERACRPRRPMPSGGRRTTSTTRSGAAGARDSPATRPSRH